MALPPERRDALRERWRRMTPDERSRVIQRRQGTRPPPARRPPG
jgi:hypothetical protein